jgi:hypothetical protein
MQPAEVQRLVERLAALDTTAADRDRLREAAGELRRLQSYLDARAVAIARRLADLSCMPERDLAEATRTSARQAQLTLERVAVVDHLPPVGVALDAGAIGGDHVDVLGRGMRSLEPELRPQFAAAADHLVGIAQRSSPEELDREVRAFARRIRTDGGRARLECQKRATRVRTWMDRDGMWCLFGRFDPETGVRLERRLQNTLDACFAGGVPNHAPDDPGQRQDFLRALALARLIDGNWPPRGLAEAIVVVDTTQPDEHGAPAVDWGLPIELPLDVLERYFADAHVYGVVVRNGVVLHAPGQLNLGRTTRLANRAQRRVLRALYPTCAIPGCAVRFDHCDIHHVVWWEAPYFGRTDLDNLLPLCSRHHHAVHDQGWHLKLAPDRTLTISYPDGATETLGPPRRNPPRTRTTRPVPMRT